MARCNALRKGTGMYIYRCEDSLEGIFSAIYRIYADHRAREEVMIRCDEEVFLFATDVTVETNTQEAVKVMRTLQREFGELDYASLCLALTSPEADKAQVVFETIRYGLKNKPAKGYLFSHLADDSILRAMKLSQNAWRERAHLYGFTRFEELENGILFAIVEPKNNVLTGLMEHFADRLPMENFAIFDKGRSVLGIHPAGQPWFVASGSELVEAFRDVSESTQEKLYADLFCHFCKTIAIKERKNITLQRNMLPLRFREFMTEFASDNS